MQHSCDRCLVIPDVHQNIAWVDLVLLAEDTPPLRPDLIVFLGDYFDAIRKDPERASLAATCAWLNATKARLGDRAIFLLGNHDIQYLEAKPACDRQRTPRHLRYKCGSAYSHNAAKRIARDLSPAFWAEARLFLCVNGWLLSHAGVAYSHWKDGGNPSAALDALEAGAGIALSTTRVPLAPPHPLLEAGRVRGGDASVGGITWLDWDEEFEDALPLPQIVGHTGSNAGARQKGRSWCLDGRQSCYGVLTSSTLSVKLSPM
jgi:3',5'-cyclic AMP phosphodiesterase CpdA